jgi:predicted membrane channel-forming protein YqfA (hemolysin III family)
MAPPTVPVDFDKIRNPTEIITNNNNNLFLIFLALCLQYGATGIFKNVVKVPRKYTFQIYLSLVFMTHLVSSGPCVEFQMFRL